MTWPSALVAELAARRCIIFTGAGASAPSISSTTQTSPPNWRALLDALRAVADPDRTISVIDGFIAKERFLDAAEVIMNRLAPADFASIMRDLLVTPRFQPSAMHEAILQIDPKVVITTNYDDIYDTYCRTGIAAAGYNVCRYYDNHLVADLRSPVRLIVKAHGCVSDPSLMVLSRSQYFKARQAYVAFFNVLDALFITHTILFVGYSLLDPDIQLVLENANISAPSAHPHYALLPDDIDPDIERAVATSYNLHIIKFPANDYAAAMSAMRELRELVDQFRVSNPQS